MVWNASAALAHSSKGLHRRKPGIDAPHHPVVVLLFDIIVNLMSCLGDQEKTACDQNQIPPRHILPENGEEWLRQSDQPGVGRELLLAVLYHVCQRLGGQRRPVLSWCTP